MYRCLRLQSTVQNRAILRYALFVVWKLYTCRYATQQTEHFWTALRCPPHLFINDKIVTCVIARLDRAIFWANLMIWFVAFIWSERTTKYGLFLLHEVDKPQNVVYCFHLKWANHKMWFIASTWSEQTTKCGLLVSLEVSKPLNADFVFFLYYPFAEIYA